MEDSVQPVRPLLEEDLQADDHLGFFFPFLGDAVTWSPGVLESWVRP